MSRTPQRPTLAVWKFASCDGCQLEVLSLADRLLTLAERVDVAFFLEASGRRAGGPYDLSLVEGSITTPDDARRIREVRAQSRTLVTIGACATSGGIQALRNFVGPGPTKRATDPPRGAQVPASVDELASIVYASPEYIDTLETSTGIADHVPVDFELRGCPISIGQLAEVVTAFLDGRRPAVPPSSVCAECKRRGTVCVMVAHQTPCLGPITQAGCGALCPAYDRGCYGCFGPSETANATALMDWWGDVLGVDAGRRVRMLRTFNANAPEFRDESRRQDERIGDAS